jgi:IS5 family transposase
LAADHAPTPGPSSHRDHARGEDQAFPTNSTKSKVRAKVGACDRVIKRVFGFAKVRYRGLRKNEHRLVVTCALANLFPWVDSPIRNYQSSQ